LTLRGLKIVVDCAHGATYKVAPAVFDELDAEVIAIGNEPNGLNINQDCGSTHPKRLQAAVLEHGADLGIAFDGDGDRVAMVDHLGNLLDGDEILYIIARSRQQAGMLQGGVVGTVMSNLGLEHALKREGIELARAAVGDRYVLEMLAAQGWQLGGESSGHIICLDRTSTGDGIVSALQVVTEMVKRGLSLAELRSGMNKYPQHMINVPVSGRVNLKEYPPILAAVRASEERLAGRGRVLLRPSGTEPVVRVMVEGEDEAEVRREATELAARVAQLLSGAAA